MHQFRLAVLLSLSVFACSGSDEEEPVSADGRGLGNVMQVTPGAAGSNGAAGTSSNAAAVAGKPGLDAPADVAAPPADAEVTFTGLASKMLVAGTGTRKPGATDTVRVHYTGWQTDGKRFDTSVDGAPVEFPLNMVIRGWTEGLQLMVEGEERRFWIPDRLAYRGVPDRPQGTLVFDVQLLAIVSP
jgi:FKBP-type peptidyl-prolyl cis-trans isomerase